MNSVIDQPGVLYNNNDATGTKTDLDTIKPRNWDFMAALYQRAQLLGMTHHLTIVCNPTATQESKSFYVCSWNSSDLDFDNPFTSLGAAVGVAAPWSVNDEFRDILLQSRRVTRRLIKGPNVEGGKLLHTFTFHTGTPLADRYGNKVVGGYHVRDSTNNPGGTVHTTDKDVASALTENWGIDNQINVVVLPATPTDVSLPTQWRLISIPTVRFYDRNVEGQS